VVIGEYETNDAGEIEVSGLLKDNYTITEIKEPLGYQLDTTPIKVTPDDFGTDKVANKTFVNKKAKIKVEGEKTWDDGDNQDGKRPTSIKVHLLADGHPIKEQTVIPDPAGKWKYSFTDLDKEANGQDIVYSVTEDAVEGYTTTINGYNIKNSYTPGKTSATVTKRWEDANNQDGKRPESVKVQLYGDDQKVGEEVELNDGNQWTTTWNDLPEKKAGKTIKYTVKEVGTIQGYTTTVDDSDIGNIIITNKHTPETTEISGEKTWDDGDNQDGKRPDSIKVNLLADGNQVDYKTVTPDPKGNWKYSFKDLPKYKNGKEIPYTITEDSVSEYSTETKGYNIVNSYTPKQISVTATKSWDDDNNRDGKRPESVKVQLYGDGQKVKGEVELNEGNQWTTTWNDLPEKKAGQTIKYTVKEVGSIEGYTTTIDDTNPGNIIIKNSHTPAQTEVSGKKTWNDANNQDGKRPETITVNLLADGKKVAEKTVSKAEEWKYKFTGLHKYNEGKEIQYTVTENSVEGYSAKIEGYDITNSYTPKEISVTVTKSWNDSNDKDKMRPGKIKVQLYADGEKHGEAVTLDKKNKWTKTWDKLQKHKDGKEIKYTAKETEKVKGYTQTVNDKDPGNIVITNSHTPKSIEGPDTNSPETGDFGNLQVYIIALFISALALAGVSRVRRKD